MITNKTLSGFQKKTKFSVSGLISDFLNFVDFFASNVTDYYEGVVPSKDPASFQKFEDVKRRCEICLNLFDRHATKFQTVDYYQLSEKIENIYEYLQLVENWPKYARTVERKGSYVRRIIIPHSKSYGESLERVEKNIARNGDYQNSWQQLGRKEGLTEEKWSTEASGRISVEVSNEGVTIQSIAKGVDSQESVWGKDLATAFEILDDDLKTLTEPETLIQSVQNLLGTRKGDDPYNQETGIDRRLLGSSVGKLNYNIIVRNVLESFAIDDSFSTIEVSDINFQQDAISYRVKVQTVAGQVQEFETQVTP